jgi:acetolactate synthase I/II/III large subunit
LFLLKENFHAFIRNFLPLSLLSAPPDWTSVSAPTSLITHQHDRFIAAAVAAFTGVMCARILKLLRWDTITAMANTAASIARALVNARIDRVFGLPGGEILLLMDELRTAGIDFVLMRHESNAGIAAAVYGKLRRQPGVVLTTLGPGAANLALSLGNSYLDQEPLLAISAQVSDDWPASHTHQRLPLLEMFGPLTKYVSQITAANVIDVLPRALAECMKRPYGPAYLTLSARDAADSFVPGMTHLPPVPSTPARTAVRESVEEVINELGQAKRPIVLLGLGVDSQNSSRLRKWVDRWNLPVAVTPKVKGIVDERSANFVGVVGGMAADDLMVQALESADLRIGFGFDPVEVDKTWYADLPIRWILEAPNVGNIVPKDAVVIDHAQFLDAICEHDPPAIWGQPFSGFQQRRQKLLREGQSTAQKMWPGDLISSLASVLPPETVVTTDVGSHKYLFGQFWPSQKPDTFWMSNGLSGMSYGIAAAIGAKCARPDVPVLAAVGDGGFSMNSQELESAERIGAPFITVVLEDRSYSLIKLSQENKKLEPYRTDFLRIDSIKIAEACGIEGVRISDPKELPSIIMRAIQQNVSLVVAVPILYSDYRRLF